jgi:hypothetical protein
MTESVATTRASFRAWWRRIHDFSWSFLGCDAAYAASLLAAQLWLGLLWFFYQGFGVARGFILLCLLAGLVILRLYPRPSASTAPAGAAALTTPLRILLVVAIATDIGMLAVSSARSIETAKIPMDEGQTSWRAARLLWQGQDPYDSRALVDLNAFRSRAAERAAAGFRANLSEQQETAALQRYDATLDTRLRDELLPPQTGEPAQRESHLYGYKYGPLVLFATAAVAPFGYAGGVMILNGLISFALFALMWAILRVVSGRQLALAGAAMLALLLDRHITRNFIDRSATDVWALVFGAAAVLACVTRRPIAGAAAVALAVGCKTMPGFLFLPMLFRFRRLAPPVAFLAGVVAIYLPWALWDWNGLLFSGILWPLYMKTDPTSWQFFAPHWATLAARAAVLVALAVVWLRFVLGREQRLFWTLAVSATLVLLASGFLRNGYVPWASLWTVTAIAEAFASATLLTNKENCHSRGNGNPAPATV